MDVSFCSDLILPGFINVSLTNIISILHFLLATYAP